mgnify:CR=1 FL=1
MSYKIGICGIGVVGSAILNCFEKIGLPIEFYDKYKNNGIGSKEYLLSTDIIFLCLPTIYSENKKEYDKSELYEICTYLSTNKYKGLVVVKSTVEPGTCRNLYKKFNLSILHNPEFLTARTAEEDFENQSHIVIGGIDKDDKNIKCLKDFYTKYWKDAKVSIANYEESEIMKICINSFYAIKIQFFNEIYAITETFEGSSYDNVVSMMIKNDWISPNHVTVPGTDGKLSYGGMCFPKDTNALYQLMLKRKTICDVLGSTISERNKMRND